MNEICDQEPVKSFAEVLSDGVEGAVSAIRLAELRESKRPEYLTKYAEKYKKRVVSRAVSALALAGASVEFALHDYTKTAVALGVAAFGAACASLVNHDLSDKYSQAADYYNDYPSQQTNDDAPHFIDRLFEHDQKR